MGHKRILAAALMLAAICPAAATAGEPDGATVIDLSRGRDGIAGQGPLPATTDAFWTPSRDADLWLCDATSPPLLGAVRVGAIILSRSRATDEPSAKIVRLADGADAGGRRRHGPLDHAGARLHAPRPARPGQRAGNSLFQRRRHERFADGGRSRRRAAGGFWPRFRLFGGTDRIPLANVQHRSEPAAEGGRGNSAGPRLPNLPVIRTT